MIKHQEHIILNYDEARKGLKILDELPDNSSRTLFVVNNDGVMLGSVTDGDIRRGLLNGYEISQTIEYFMNTKFKYLKDGEDNVYLIKEFKKASINLIPMLDDEFKILEILDLHLTKTLLPFSALLMAGGRGERLKPFTDSIPKPMLKVGDKPILEINIDRLISYGVTEIYISVKYLKDQIMDYFGDGSNKGIKIHYLEENEPLGTLGALAHIEKIIHHDLLVMNSDLLTNIDFEDFYNFYKAQDATMALASIPYHVSIPYAVLKTNDHTVESFIEKPTYTYYSNGGIYLMKFQLKKHISKGCFYNATDLMDKLITESGTNLVHYPLLGYWLDIGKHQDFIKAQEDIKHIVL
ncbi:nucleotidyltransferase family protein [Pedobacter sp. MW01-1-1]|uniref:nucleotidyltransferase family protein n=1 Tax=Pedobacter sp. MW01-1-1 TaxID=3383027 RepID=UPI003FEE6026